ncbi:hypothetical protein HOK51_09995 [Candidatus Woesearchaeota archaeon]|jgi:hypothetical protein|nr:hypothetical protein [Candidatus Woesearchaeota archaeon]MBT6520155.1 hypothetical protein [Candidatus Woesearchaeota archaeon]MBT7366760.1 hypothetical protein [Candidatus Woesearchaeota archaeon]
MESVETYFLRYAFPCTSSKVLRGELSESEREALEKKIELGVNVSREEIERIFEVAFERIKKLAFDSGKDYWDLSIIKKYFHKYHNQCIDSGEGEYANYPTAMREVCKVKLAEVIGKEKEILKVKYINSDNVARNVVGKLLPSINIGDKIYVHLGFAVEIEK